MLTLLNLGNRFLHAVDSKLVVQHFQYRTNDENYLPWTGMLRCSRMIPFVRLCYCRRCLPDLEIVVLKIVPCEGCGAAGSPYCPPALAGRQVTCRGNIMCALTELFLSPLLMVPAARWLHQRILAST
jgi:hypothetical protein